MTLEEFKHAIEKNEEPQNLHHLLKALWSDAQGKWDDAHDFSQTDDSENGAWVHAYLHRKEGDIGQCILLVPSRRTESIISQPRR